VQRTDLERLIPVHGDCGVLVASCHVVMTAANPSNREALSFQKANHLLAGWTWQRGHDLDGGQIDLDVPN